jgi:NADH-quinone oxidoreductase subunit M
MNTLLGCILLLPWSPLLAPAALTWNRAVLAASVTFVLATVSLLAGHLPVDELTLWLLPYASSIYLVMLLFLPRSERSRSTLQALLLGLGLDLWFFSLQSPLALALVFPLTMLPLFRQLPPGRTRRFMTVFMGTASGLLTVGALGLHIAPVGEPAPAWAVLSVAVAVCIRKAVFPLHQWLPALTEEAPWSATVAFCSPQLAAYVAVRLLSPHGAAQLLVTLGVLALVTAVYGASLALGNKSLRGVYASLLMGQTSLVFTGLQCTTSAGLAGGLAAWLSGGIALTGVGVTIWALEARRGRLRLDRFHGGFDSSPVLAGCFLVLGLSAVGFPGTVGFLSQELLLDGTMHVYPHVGVLAAVTSCLNGITVMSSFFHVFCGSAASYPASHAIRGREKLAILLLLGLLVGFGLCPQAFLASRSRIAQDVLNHRLSLPR